MRTTRDGFALPVALLTMIVIGAIVTGGFYASSQENRISTSSDLASQAFYVAEYGIEKALGTWTNDVLAMITDPQVFPDSAVLVGGDTLGTYALGVRPLGNRLYLVSSEGSVTQASRTARRQLGSIVRITTAEMPYHSALSVFGGLTAKGNSQIRGDDTGGPNCAPGATVAGVTAVDASLISSGGSSEIFGEPDVAEETSLDTTTLSNFGSVHLEDLIAQATNVYEAGDSENGMGPATYTDEEGNQVCDTSVRSNWGDETLQGPCANHFPIIHAKGDLHLKTGTGQGILIVEGDLRASGNFDFYGVVIVKGSLRTSGTGNHFEGSVIVKGDGELDSESITTGNSLVQYSRCRVNNAFNAALAPELINSRSWLDFTAMTRAPL